MPKILFIMQWFDPEPQLKGLILIKKLQERGLDIEVITGFPNYPRGNLYEGYSVKFYQKEIIDGVTIHRVPLYPSHSNSGIGRIINYTSFAIAAFFGAMILSSQFKLMYVCGPPVTLGLAGILVSKLRKIPMVYDIQDLWPDTLKETGMFSSKLGLKIVGALCKKLYKNSTHLLTQSEGVKDLIILRGCDPKKITTIYNWGYEKKEKINYQTGVIDNELENIKKSNKFKIFFAGNFGKAQQLETVLNSARILMEKKSNINIYLLGDGVELNSLILKSVELKLDNLIFVPRVPISAVTKYLNNADALLLHLKKSNLFAITIPSKLQHYLMVGRPLIVAVEGESTEIVMKNKLGVCSISSDPISMANAMLNLSHLDEAELYAIGIRCNKFYENNMSLESGANKFAKIFINNLKNQTIV